jgi:hypothetical protein
MVLWNLLDGGPSHSGPLLRPSESIRGGTPSTNPRQMRGGLMNDRSDQGMVPSTEAFTFYIRT